MRKWRAAILVVLGALIALAAGICGYRAWRSPTTGGHACIIFMTFALEDYARDHGGHFPAGEASPEASLSLLYKKGYVAAWHVRGKSVPVETAQRILEGGGLLGPDTCGWHYVEGLTLADDARLAILWDKVGGVAHGGQQTRDGGRDVLFAGGNRDWVTADQWPAFLAEQAQLLAGRSLRAIAGAPLFTAVIQLPDGSRIDQVEGHYELAHRHEGPGGSGWGKLSGGGLCRADLTWYHAPIETGTQTYTLSFSNLVSEPVTVRFEASSASPASSRVQDAACA
jgi:hypothetical protein